MISLKQIRFATMISQEFKEAHLDTEWHLISGMRHVLVHDYYQVSFKFIWNVIKHDLNPLREQIEKYRANMSYQSPSEMEVILVSLST